jgi:hypothetical protein
VGCLLTKWEAQYCQRRRKEEKRKEKMHVEACGGKKSHRLWEGFICVDSG